MIGQFKPIAFNRLIEFESNSNPTGVDLHTFAYRGLMAMGSKGQYGR